MSWFKRITTYIDENFDDFIMRFFPDSSPVRINNGVRLNPSPCCGHNDCFSFSTVINAGNCFSCSEKGTKVGFVEKSLGVERARIELEKWSGVKRSKSETESVEETSEKKRISRLNEISEIAINFYHTQLFSNNPEADKALTKQLGSNIAKGERGHFEHTLKDFKVGLSLDTFDVLTGILEREGYTEEELTEANKLIWIPPFNLVYPFFDVSGNVVMIKTKPFKRVCLGTPQLKGGHARNCLFETYDVSGSAKRDHEEETGHRMSPDVYTSGTRDNSFYFNPEQKGKQKYMLLVEGQDDVITAYEEMKKDYPEMLRDFKIVGLGGNVKEGTFSSPFFRQFERIYEAFDNDDAGDKYRERLDKEAAEIQVYGIKIDDDYKDIDDYLKVPVESHDIKNLIADAKSIESKHILIEREGTHKHLWHAKNRKFMLSFEIESYKKEQAQLFGTLTTTINGVPTDKKVIGIDRGSVPPALQPARIQLSSFLDKYYNEVLWDNSAPIKTLSELTDIIHLTKSSHIVVRQIAWYLHKASESEYEKKFNYISRAIRDERIIAEILREVNAFTNSAIDPHALFPKVNLSQFFHVTNNDAYFYFSRVVNDGESPRLVPCLLSNRKEEIRLDLMKRKDKQSLLLIQNKYEVPFEVETAVMDPIEVSLQPYWVDRWKDGDITDEEIDPAFLIKEIENFIRKCYYLEESTLKVLSLWIYATYYYMLFKSGFPYLMFTGPKGTGKSTLDTLVYLLSLNAKLALDMSESALYRSITFEGGTFILDEVEHLSDKKSADVNGYAKILKGGYSDNAYVYRTNMDKGGATEKFSVYGPKVISNINGIDDVIADRCIFVRTFRVPEEKLRGLEDPQLYKEEMRSFVHSISSRCVISALENFGKVSNIFNGMDALFETGNARLTQIIKPLVTIAKFVGGDYEEHLMKYYEGEIKQSKKEIDESTVEGMVRSVLKRVSEEYLGMQSEIWATDPTQHLYSSKIDYSHTTRVFEIDNLHVKVLCEELSNGEDIEMKTINQTLKAVLGPSFDVKRHRKQTTATIADENLQHQLGGKKHIRVYRYYLNAEDYVDTTEYNKYRTANDEEPAMF